MINIVCLKWGTKYGPEYVNRLFAGVKRNTTVDFKFHCFTEDTTNLNAEIVTHPLPFNTLEGWWNKLYLFSKDLPIPLGEKIFFIDLDTLIVSNIDSLLNLDCKDIIVLRDFYTGIATTVVGNDNVGSGLMSWYHGNYNNIWTTFIANPKLAIHEMNPHGDQKWVQKHATIRRYWQDVTLDKVVSFKVHCNQGLPEKAAIVCYHGKPSIPESYSQRNRVWKFDIAPQLWVKDHWRE
jgi:hypothetical protein